MANRKPIFSFISTIIIFTTFLISVNSQQSEVSFTVNNFTAGDSRLRLQGTASINNGQLVLINHENSTWNTGRALYSSQVRIWDRNGNIARFQTSFSFVVQNIADFPPGEGFIFFLSPTFEIPPDSSRGELGVVNARTHFNNFVGVEFDTFVNTWDPNYPHIGIDMNSLISARTVRWNRISGQLVRVNANYDSESKVLSVTVTYPNGQASSISQFIDLTYVLPETVWIGLSATTASSFRQLTSIRSWSFTSSLKRSNNLLSIIDE